jgi:translation initiation factor 2 gamma subunit (eIF-2gamma)
MRFISFVSPSAELNLDYIVDNPWIIIPCSALRNTNIDEVIQWLIKQADAPKK